MEDMMKFGPEDMIGSIWDECGKTNIVQILISHEENNINSIQFVYVVDGNLVRSKVHGETRGMKFDAVVFDYPREYLVSVSGWCERSGFRESLSFGTNKHKYGPFGGAHNTEIEDDCKFAYNFRPRSSFGGFHGSVDFSGYVSIGVYIRPVRSLVEIDSTDSGSG